MTLDRVGRFKNGFPGKLEAHQINDWWSIWFHNRWKSEQSTGSNSNTHPIFSWVLQPWNAQWYGDRWHTCCDLCHSVFLIQPRSVYPQIVGHRVCVSLFSGQTTPLSWNCSLFRRNRENWKTTFPCFWRCRPAKKKLRWDPCILGCFLTTSQIDSSLNFKKKLRWDPCIFGCVLTTSRIDSSLNLKKEIKMGSMQFWVRSDNVTDRFVSKFRLRFRL